MPIYEYKCAKGHTFEAIQRMADDPLSECEECGAPVERVFHPVAVHFKGSGFYSTDYGSKSKSKGRDGSESSSDGDSGGGSSSGGGSGEGSSEGSGDAGSAKKDGGKGEGAAKSSASAD